MKSKHSYVVLIDLPEMLEFEVSPTKVTPEKIANLEKENMESDGELFKFVSKIEKRMRVNFSFIGEDVISEKFYKRFLVNGGGFIEVMYQAPAAIIAHFIEEDRANKFADSLKSTIREVVEDKKAATILENLVEVNTEKEEPLTYKKWSQLTHIRGMIEK